LGFSVLLSVKD
jgi:hypothetical protein